MNLIDSGSSWLLSRLQESAGRAMTYRRGSQTTAVTAVRKVDEETITGADGTPEIIRSYSIIVDADDLGFEPRAGHQITETIGVESVRWEVAPRGDGPCFEWWGQSRQAYRIFVVQVA